MATPSRFIARWKPSISVSFFIAFKKSTGEGAIFIKGQTDIYFLARIFLEMRKKII